MGIVVDSNKPDYVQGDFLVRGLVGADPATGKVAVGRRRPPRPGRAAARARRRERGPRPARGARVRMAALGGRAPAGALVFSCNGRGRDDVRLPPPRRRGGRCTRSAAPRPRASSPRARSARSAASRSCTGSPPPSPSSPDPRASGARRALAPRPVASRRVDVSGRTVLLTGATGGLGHAIARALARARRVAGAHRPPRGRARAAGGRDRRPRGRVRPRRPGRPRPAARRRRRRRRPDRQRRRCPAAAT